MQDSTNTLARADVYFTESYWKKTYYTLGMILILLGLPVLVATFFFPSANFVDTTLWKIISGVIVVLVVPAGLARLAVRNYPRSSVFDTSTLIITRSYVSFFAHTIPLNDVKRISITFNSSKPEKYVYQNSRIIIETFYEKYTLGLIITNEASIKVIQEAAQTLRARRISIDCSNGAPGSFPFHVTQ